MLYSIRVACHTLLNLHITIAIDLMIKVLYINKMYKKFEFEKGSRDRNEK